MLSGLKKAVRKKYPSVFYFTAFLFSSAKIFFSPLAYPYIKKIRKIEKIFPGIKNNTASQHVLFFSARQEPDHIIVLTILSWALKLRGHTTSVIGCDRALVKACNSGSSPKIDPWVCMRCVAFARHAHKTSGLYLEWLSQLYSNESKKEAKKIVANLAPAAFPSFTYKSVMVGDLIRVSIAHFLKTSAINTSSREVEKIYKDWLETAIVLVDSFNDYLDTKKPDTIVMLNGLFAAERIMLELARMRNIHVVTYEVGFRPHTFFFQHNKPINMCNNDYWPRYKDTPLTAKQNAELNDYMNEREKGKGYLINYFPNIISDKNEIFAKFKINPDKDYFILFPNITWDSTLFNCDIYFKSMIDWIKETMQFFIENPADQLVIRIHPAESTLDNADRDSVMDAITKAYPVLPDNIIIIPSHSVISSYVLMQYAKVGLVYGSTTGIEMGLRGLPVIVSGNIYYRGLEVSIDPKTKEEYFWLLHAFEENNYEFDKERSIETWRRYAYFGMFRAALPIAQLDYPSISSDPSITFSDLKEMAEGTDPNLDIICDGIISEGDFLVWDN